MMLSAWPTTVDEDKILAYIWGQETEDERYNQRKLGV